MSKLSGRVNLTLEMPVCIQIEKEAEKKGITRTQFIKESINEKLIFSEKIDFEHELKELKGEIKEMKLLIISLLENIRK